MKKVKPADCVHSPVWVISGLLGAIIGGATVMFIGRAKWIAHDVAYTDLAAVMLGCVTLILAMLTLAIAIAAIYGYQKLQNMAQEWVTTGVNDYVEDNVDEKIAAEFEKFMSKNPIGKEIENYFSNQNRKNSELDEDEREFASERYNFDDRFAEEFLKSLAEQVKSEDLKNEDTDAN